VDAIRSHLEPLDRNELPEQHQPDLPWLSVGYQPWDLLWYRVHGPYESEAGYRFNPNKLVLDPYARLTQVC